jgi:DNA mismatch repair protein MutS2
MATLGELEMIFAKARFAIDFDCAIPRFGGRLLLRDARHPLLEDVLRRQRKPVVPISLELDARANTLLISGPNTGGKTVTLKTVGLLTLMAQSGLPVPAPKPSSPSSDRCWPTSATTSRYRKASARFPRTSRTSARWRST